jgi:tetratricopeptide (TPR) repeat protein
MEEQLQSVEQGVKKAWPTVMAWVGGISALIGLFASIYGGVAWFRNHHQENAESKAKFALAQTQANHGEFQASVQTYGEILKTNPLDRQALDQQLSTTMLWVENFRVSAREDQNAADLAAPALDQALSILDAGFSRTKSSATADVEAHIGWAHWLNQHIAQRESGSEAEKDLRAAIASDPSNIYANAMLASWMLQNGGNVEDAVHHFDIAVSSGNARPFVRRMQFGSLTDLDEPGVRSALIKAANDMRKSNESLDEEYKRRVDGFCFNPIVTDHAELAETLAAIPLEEAWQTYLWLDDSPQDQQSHNLNHEFIHANLLEVNGQRQASIEQFRQLQKELGNSPGTIHDAVADAIIRLSHH